jgi:hypothetical protein
MPMHGFSGYSGSRENYSEQQTCSDWPSKKLIVEETEKWGKLVKFSLRGARPTAVASGCSKNELPVYSCWLITAATFRLHFDDRVDPVVTSAPD